MIPIWLNRLRLRLRALLSREHDAELRNELQLHLDLLAAEYVARGMSATDARARAHREFGNATRVQETSHQLFTMPLLDGVWRDLLYALRSLVRGPSFAALVSVTLALGIGASTAIFSLIDVVLIRPLPFPGAEQLAVVWETAPRVGYPKVDVAPANYVDWVQQSDVFDGLAAYSGNAFNLTGQGRPERLDGVQVTPNLFSVIGVDPVLGRAFLSPEGTRGNRGFVILSHGLWQRRFGGDVSIVGRAILLNGESHVVVGVMPKGFQFPREETQLWTPVAYSAADTPTRNRRFLRVVGRLKVGRSWTQAQSEFDTIATRLAATYSEANRGYEATVVPLAEEFVGEARASLFLLEAAALLVLVVACGNVAGLFITRAIRRRPEIALRFALGASRGHIVRQLVIEGIALSATGGAIGVVVALVTVDWLGTLIPPPLRGAVAPALDWRMLVFAVTTSVLSGIVFGLAPQWAISGSKLIRSLAGRGTQLPRERVRAALVTTQIAMAVIVVAATGLLVRTLINLQNVDPGFRTENVLTARMEVSSSGASTLDRRKRFYAEVLDRIRQLPGVVSAGFTTFLPYTNFGGSIELVLREQPDLPDAAKFAYRREVTPDYLTAIGVQLVAGRWLTEHDTLGQAPVAVVNEYIASLLGSGVVGTQLKLGAPDTPWITIVGVVANIREEGLETPPQRGTVYTPVAQSQQAWYFNPRDLAVRVSGDPSHFAAAIEGVVWSIDKDQSVSNVRMLEAVVDGQIRARKTQVTLLIVFAAVVVFLSALGVYGLMSFVVTARTQEFGVRIALGADRGRLAAFVARQGLVWLATGTAVGLTITVLVSRGLERLLYGVRPLDPATLMSATLLLCLVASVAALFPIYRATCIDPLTALRAE